MRRFAALAILLVAGSRLLAQAAAAPPPALFTSTTSVIGPTIGVGGIDGASLAIGGRYEKGVKQLPDLGNGVLGIGAIVNVYQYSSANFGAGSSDFRFVQFGGTVNYHFHVDDPKWDPFLGLGLGYVVANVSGLGTANSGLFTVGYVGARYFYTPNMAIQADLGVGSSTLNVGLMFRP
jgi:hypothetical protein